MENNPYIGPFAERLAQLRENKGYSAREMSLSLGQSHSYINDIESKKNFPEMLNFFDMCAYLGLTPYEFFEYLKESAWSDNELAQEFDKLDEQSKAYFLKMIRDANNRPK